MKKLIWLITAVLTLALLSGCTSSHDVTDENQDETVWLNMNTTYQAPTELPDGGGERVKVILLIGQSNATGCGLNDYLKKNLEINKGKYERQEIGNGSTTIRFDRAKETHKSIERGVGEISGDIEGATADTVYDSETQAFEVAPRYSIPDPDPSGAFYDDMPIGRNIQKVLLKSFEQHLYFISRSLALLWLLEVVVDTAEEDKRVFVSSLW